MDHLRLFFAFVLTPEQRAAIARYRRQLPSLPVRWSPAENYHLTLKFLGERPRGELDAWRAIGAALRGTPSELILDGLACWPKSGVLVLNADDTPPSLQQLVRQLDELASALGLPRESRDYQAHVTLARRCRQAPDVPPPHLALRLSRIGLYQSLSSDRGLVYRLCDSWELADA